MDEFERSEINEKLTLPLLKNKSPFALSENEQFFKADDWAWLFLRLNKEYDAAYSKRQRSIDESSAQISRNRKVSIQHHGNQINPPETKALTSCRDVPSNKNGAEIFGLSDWICPKTRFLQELEIEKNGSWFYPLKRILCVGNASNANVATLEYRKSIAFRPLGILTNGNALLAHETSFGYERYSTTTRIKSPARPLNSKNNLIQALINCSIPPAGQMDSLLKLAKITRRVVMSIEKLQSYRTVRPFKITEIDECDWTSLIDPERYDDNFLSFKEEPAVWRAIEFDTLSPQVTLHRDMLRQLNDEFEKIDKNRESAFRLNKRFDCLPGAFNDKNNASNFGESRLKVLLIVAELIKLGYAENKIANFLYSSDSHINYNRKWYNYLDENIGKYSDEGRELIDRGYRWLIHAQRSNNMDLKGFKKQKKGPRPPSVRSTPEPQE